MLPVLCTVLYTVSCIRLRLTFWSYTMTVVIVVLSHSLSIRNATFSCQIFLKFTGLTCCANKWKNLQEYWLGHNFYVDKHLSAQCCLVSLVLLTVLYCKLYYTFYHALYLVLLIYWGILKALHSKLFTTVYCILCI